MIPILFRSGETAYTGGGIGPLSDATSCSVTEELNGAYQLKMTLPRTTARLSDLAVALQILAAPNPFDQAQPFRITHINKRLLGEIEITAQHIAYDLRKNPVGNYTSPFTSPTAAMAWMSSNQLAALNRFTFSTDVPGSSELNPKSMTVEGPAYIWDLLGSGENTLVGEFGGELKFDRRAVALLQHRGEDRGFEILYGVNMTDLSYEVDGDEMYSAILPIWQSGSDKVVGNVHYPTVYVPGSGQWVPIRTSGAERVEIFDMTRYFSSKPSVDALNGAATTYMRNKSPNAPEIRVKVTAVPPGSRGLQTLEEVQLGDSIRVKHDGLNVDVKTRVVQTVYDVLRDRYTSFDVEGRVYGVATQIAKIGKQIKTGRVAY